MKQFTVRKALEADIPEIHTLLEHYADQGIILRRSREDILKNLGSFFVAADDGHIRGCSAIRDFGNDLLEVRSLVVDPEFQGRGLGRAIVGAIVDELGKTRSKWRLFTLTGRPEFFAKQGFRTVAREMFPEKIWSDCRNCAKNTCCDEVAMIFTEADPLPSLGK